jgi:hypothetical protein
MRSLSRGSVLLPKFIAPRAREGGASGRLLRRGFVVIGLLLLPRFAWAHTLGLSVANFEVRDGFVEAHVAFASTESLGGLRLDRNDDGRVTAADLVAARDDLRDFVLDGIDVSADGFRCPAAFRGASLAEPDGLVLEASYSCPTGATEVAVTLYYLSQLPPGHREVARIVAGSSTAEAVLSADRRGLVLRVPGSTVTARGRNIRLLVAAIAAIAFAVYHARRRRRAQFKAS